MGYTLHMSRPSILILLGGLTVLLPFLGLPSTLRTPLLVVFGAYVLGIGLSLRTHQE
jgi:hypothetical protein